MRNDVRSDVSSDDKAFRLMTALSNVDPELLERSEKAIARKAEEKKGKIIPFRGIGIAVAAVFCLGIAGVSLYNIGFWGHEGGVMTTSETAPMTIMSDTSTGTSKMSVAEEAAAVTETCSEEDNGAMRTEEVRTDTADMLIDTTVSYETFRENCRYVEHLPQELPSDLRFVYGYTTEGVVTLVFEGSCVGEFLESEMTVEFAEVLSDELVIYTLDEGDVTVDNVENLVNNGVVAVRYDDGVVEIFRGRLVPREIVDMLK